MGTTRTPPSRAGRQGRQALRAIEELIELAECKPAERGFDLACTSFGVDAACGMANAGTNELRPDEQLVIRAVAASCGGAWRLGENPPDAYLTIDGEEVAVEISTLTQYVLDENGGLKPRYSEDATALWVVREMKDALRDHIPNGRTVVLIMASPIRKARKVRDRLIEIILEYIARGVDVDALEDVYSNQIKIVIKAAGQPDPEKLHGAVTNQNSSPDILLNARTILEDRISVKATKCHALSSKGPVWLALLNDYWLAGDDTYMQAFEMFSVTHPFQKIFLVSGGGAVAQLFPATATRARDPPRS